MTKNTDDINISDIPKAAPVDVVAKLFDELITPICNNCDAEWVVPCRCKGFPKLCMKLDLTLTGVVAVLAANGLGYVELNDSGPLCMPARFIPIRDTDS